MRASAIIEGKPDYLKIASDAHVEDFHRYDIASSESLSLQAHCDAHYNLSQHAVSGIYCESPNGGGMVQAKGSFGIAPRQDIDFRVSAENVSAQFLAALLRHTKKNVPEDLNATGMVSLAFTVHAGDDGERVWAGNGQSSPLKVQSSVLGKPLLVDASTWHLVGPGTLTPSVLVSKPKKLHPPQDELPQPLDRAFVFEPVSLDLGGPAPVLVSGWFGREQYQADLKGEADIERLLQVGRLLGIPTVGAELTGTAKGNLNVSGSWTGFALPGITGSAQLHGVTAKLNGVASPLKIQSAQFTADQTSVSLSKASGAFAEVHSALDFSALWSRDCEPQCGITFEVRADQINVDELNSLLNPRAQKRPWYAELANTVMGSNRKSLPEIHATGKFTAARVQLKNVTAGHVSGNVNITPTGFTLDTVNADLFGGEVCRRYRSGFQHGTPVYSSNGNLVTVGITNVSTLMHDSWGSGKITAAYKGGASGWNGDELVASAKGTANFQWRDGTFQHISLDAPGKPLQFKVFAGKLELNKGVLTISESKLQAPKEHL